MSEKTAWDIWYEKGKAAHAKSPHHNLHEDYKAAGGPPTSKTGGCTMEWSRFYEGWREGEQARIKALYPVEEFLSELDKLCVKYNAIINSGCGCCGAGGSFSNGNPDDKYEFSFSCPNTGEDLTHNT